MVEHSTHQPKVKGSSPAATAAATSTLALGPGVIKRYTSVFTNVFSIEYKSTKCQSTEFYCILCHSTQCHST